MIGRLIAPGFDNLPGIARSRTFIDARLTIDSWTENGAENLTIAAG